LRGSPAYAKPNREPSGAPPGVARGVPACEVLAMPNVQAEIETALLAASKDPDEGVRNAVAQALEAWDTRGRVEDMLEALDDPSKIVQVRALYALGDVRDPRATEGLIQVLRSAPVDQRGIAIRLLGQRRDPRAIGPLMEALDDPSVDVRMLAVEALGGFQDGRLTEVFLAMLPGAEEEVQLKLLEVLAPLGDPRSIPVLLPLLQDPSAAVRRLAAEALGQAELPPPNDQ
jgi:HEAT repeat protein